MIDSYELCQNTITQLLQGANNRLQSELQEIIDAYSEQSGQTQDGFLYLGHWYSTKPTTLSYHYQTGLPDELVPLMEEYLAESEQVSRDKESMIQCMYLLCLHVNTIHDLRDTLPECVVRFIPQIADTQRARSAGFSLENLPPTAQQHFDKMLPIFQKYSALNLIY